VASSSTDTVVVNIDLPRFEKAVADAALSEMLAIGAHVQGEIQRNAPIATGTLGKSFAVLQGAPVDRGMAVTVGSPFWGGPVGYGAHMEFGTRPHWAPIEPLITWVREKFRYQAMGVKFAGASGTGGFVARPSRKGTKKFSDRQIVNIAKAVQYAISKRGTKERLYVLQAIASMGMPYSVAFDSSRMTYVLNVSNELRDRGLWKKIGDKL
jgi:hypothetical protein